MYPFDAVDDDEIVRGKSDWITPELAERLSQHPLESVETEFPHYVRSVDSPDDVVRPRENHPVFFGCYDWHSAVHSHWALIRQLRLFEEHPRESKIRETIDRRLTPENVRTEVETFEENPSFEKPYGWAWLLRLAAELRLWDEPTADEWRSALEPLEATIRELVRSEFLTQDRPFRVGTHGNTAFALAGVVDYARVIGDDSLESEAEETAREFFGDDRDYPVEYEPLGWDFVSPALTEADLMYRVYDPDPFAAWLVEFFPDLTEAPFDSILDPVRVDSDPDEGVALHLVGLNVSKAWCLAGIASTLEASGDHPYVTLFEESAWEHTKAGLDGAFTDDYAGSHWLSSFVLYLLTRTDGGIAPE
ncbi:Protein-tyrosine-phosphatase [Halalkaliarchaeum sp. AArc-CO]|uniref:DUF2891 domain-containing protein n=1 Tax=unclassified Halalkaliarchaeum TaxID=2678344 RepID=UPI00217EB29D|nr:MULTISPECIES: DUF2891 domain-containing protein [unclassified Halalkaliarchaeum]MDR5671639.1 DUF2891 domain-containing protein [Halalkaliarchaeum sp. AArc-GB]UWG51140.1 Protein-tyrosine-phosphatase [Halalkaliarchaeum sp. AArc-CO]